jgi:hypothetical protein
MATAMASDAAASATNDDVENHIPPTTTSREEGENRFRGGDFAAADLPTTTTTTTTTTTLAATDKTVGIFVSGGGGEEGGDEDDSTKSVFSFDSCDREGGGVMPVRVRGVARRFREKRLSRNGRHNPDDVEAGVAVGGEPPFASVVGPSVEYDADAANACPCRCLYFTLKETVCLVLSALGCGLFLAGIIALCMYLAGGYFDGG